MIIVVLTVFILVLIGGFIVQAHASKKFMFSDYETKPPPNSWRPNGDTITPLTQKQIDARKTLS